MRNSRHREENNTHHWNFVEVSVFNNPFNILWKVVAVGALAALLWLVNLSAASAQGSSYHPARVFFIGGEGAWDYTSVDPVNHRLYVSHNTEVDSIDLISGRPAGKVTGLQSARGIVLLPELHHGFVASYRMNAVLVFDLDTLKILQTIHTDDRPDALTYEPMTSSLIAFTHNQAANVIRAKDSTVVGRIPLKGSPEFAVPDGHGKVFVSLQDTNEIAEIDPGTLTLDYRWPVAPCIAPTSLAIDSKARRLFTGCHNRTLAILDADTGKVVKTLPIGPGVDGTVFDARTGLAFVSSGGDGTVALIKSDGGDNYRVVGSVPSGETGRTIALDPTTASVYVPFAKKPASGEQEGVDGTFSVVEIKK